MKNNYISPNRDDPAWQCGVCGGDIFADELVHLIDGTAVCPDCFFDFSFDYFADKMVCGSEIKEMLDTNDTERDG